VQKRSLEECQKKTCLHLGSKRPPGPAEPEHFPPILLRKKKRQRENTEGRLSRPKYGLDPFDDSSLLENSPGAKKGRGPRKTPFAWLEEYQSLVGTAGTRVSPLPSELGADPRDRASFATQSVSARKLTPDLRGSTYSDNPRFLASRPSGGRAPGFIARNSNPDARKAILSFSPGSREYKS